MVAALARAAATVTMPDGLPALTAIKTLPLSIPEPCFVVAEIDIIFDQTFHAGMDGYTVTGRALVGHSDDIAASRYINMLIQRDGPTSLKAAIEATKVPPTSPAGGSALYGTCKTLRVAAVRGRRMFQWAGANEYLGCEIQVEVWG
jgi:hypothetical protein